MAGEEHASLEFTQILSSLDRKFEIIHVKWSDDQLFEAKFRTSIQRDSEDFNALCDEWVDLFSESTNTVWVKKISNTGPKIRFRKQYQCWTQESKVVQKELLFDARRCRGTLDMKVLTDNPQTRRKNKHIKMGLNVVVKINFTHLHKVNIRNPYSFFVHTCDPQPEPPKPIIQPNENLTKLVANMVQKGLNASSKADPLYIHQEIIQYPHAHQVPTNNINVITEPDGLIDTNQIITLDLNMGKSLQIPQQLEKDPTDIQINTQLTTGQLNQKIISNDLLQSQIQVQNLDHLQLSQVLPLQSMELAQMVVGTPQIDMNEPLLMCQPTIMFDPSQVIPVTHTLSPHFVQVHSHNVHNQQGHYL